ncbi:hypothetical protein BN8_03806 [Fibrisoma limi BUZ 3]|uniref:Uncharacterized protein n=1 Tax=Fibrisoma limi BUZ 3 TaxID=1185876 RepID=I2GL38_9BACT|nr:hypothetical protein BN8_03806 [Fibrisoma limi BUZ 3]
MASILATNFNLYHSLCQVPKPDTTFTNQPVQSGLFSPVRVTFQPEIPTDRHAETRQGSQHFEPVNASKLKVRRVGVNQLKSP